MKYTRMFRNENGIMAIIGEEASQYDYYDFNGNLITEAEYKASNELENDTGLTGLYDYDTDMFQVLDEHGEVVLEVECSWAYYYIYHDFDNYVLCHYGEGENDQIAVVKENEVDLSDMLLVNSITPKIKPYWDILRGDIEILNEDGSAETVWGFCRGISGCEYYYDRMDNRKIKLYDIEQSGTPLMYCYEEEYVDWGYSSSLYSYQYGELEELLNCWWMYQPTEYYSDTELRETPHLFYDEENKPYTEDTIWESEIASIFEINGEKVTMEEYDTIRLKYSFFSLYGYM